MRALLLAALLATLACGGSGDSTSLDGGVDATPGAGADGGGGLDPDGAPGPDGAPAGQVQIFMPTPYRQLSDSPFLPLGLADFQVEDFEDGEMNLTGAVLDPIGGGLSSIFGEAGIDSVDADDGDATDGDCDGCDSWRTGALDIGFEPTARGLPTHVGFVVTDCLVGRTVLFEARDAANHVLAHLDTESFCDDAWGQTTGEDRFIGIAAPQGVISIYVLASGGGVEIDHVQIGWEE